MGRGGMGGSDYGDWELTSPTTLVLVGRTGNGKSATGNSLLASKAFESRCSSSSVTSTCDLKSTTREDGRCLRVIDTPGLFDPDMPEEFVMKEIIKCIDLAKDGVHALLLVLSVRNRFTPEEMAAVESLQAIFGERVVNYMVIVFTSGDDLEDQTLDEYLREGASSFLQIFLQKCGNRKVLLDNRTRDKAKKEQQVEDLLHVIDDMLVENGGVPYSNDLFREAQALKARKDKINDKSDGDSKELQAMKMTMRQEYAEQLEQIKSMVEEKLRLNSERLEERLVAEQEARQEVEKRARLDKVQSDTAIRELREALEKANKEREEFMREMHSKRSGCSIV